MSLNTEMLGVLDTDLSRNLENTDEYKQMVRVLNSLYLVLEKEVADAVWTEFKAFVKVANVK